MSVCTSVCALVGGVARTCMRACEGVRACTYYACMIYHILQHTILRNIFMLASFSPTNHFSF